MKRALPIGIVGTLGWFVGLVIEIGISAKSDTIWICVTGIGLGLLGMLYIIRGLRRTKRN